MSRAFFDQIDDELRGLLGPGLRSYHGERNARLLKLWFGHAAVHFEVQTLSLRWSPGSRPALEIGLHLEHPDARVNQGLMLSLAHQEPLWRAALAHASAGPAIGPRGAQWPAGVGIHGGDLGR